jgi:hypothetical protein
MTSLKTLALLKDSVEIKVNLDGLPLLRHVRRLFLKVITDL